jgi:type VI secretion system secreted protein Hcp
MAFDAFLEFPDAVVGVQGSPKVTGESQDKVHPNSVDITSFSFGVENKTSIGSATGGAGAGKAAFQEMEITKKIDLASPGLFAAASVTGAHFNQMNLFIRKAGSGADYLVYRFRLVYVTSITWAGSGGDEFPQEGVTFQYAAFQMSYAPTQSNGSLGNPSVASWSQVTNTNTFGVPGVP